METSQKQKGKSFKHVFKGSVLVNALLDHDRDRFQSREEAVMFAQHLLAAGHLRSVVDQDEFEDGVALYKWADASLVKEAKKMVSTTSTHIPKKRLIEMVDLQHSGEEATTVEATKQKLLHITDGPAQQPAPQQPKVAWPEGGLKSQTSPHSQVVVSIQQSLAPPAFNFEERKLDCRSLDLENIYPESDEGRDCDKQLSLTGTHESATECQRQGRSTSRQPRSHISTTTPTHSESLRSSEALAAHTQRQSPRLIPRRNQSCETSNSLIPRRNPSCDRSTINLASEHNQKEMRPRSQSFTKSATQSVSQNQLPTKLTKGSALPRSQSFNKPLTVAPPKTEPSGSQTQLVNARNNRSQSAQRQACLRSTTNGNGSLQKSPSTDNSSKPVSRAQSFNSVSRPQASPNTTKELLSKLPCSRSSSTDCLNQAVSSQPQRSNIPRFTSPTRIARKNEPQQALPGNQASNPGPAPRAPPRRQRTPNRQGVNGQQATSINGAQRKEGCENTKAVGDSHNMCHYDGVDMPSLDIHTLQKSSAEIQIPEQDFSNPPNIGSLQNDASSTTGHPSDIPRYAESESQIREQMARMQEEHKTAVRSYEEKVSQLKEQCQGRNLAAVPTDTDLYAKQCQSRNAKAMLMDTDMHGKNTTEACMGSRAPTPPPVPPSFSASHSQSPSVPPPPPPPSSTKHPPIPIQPNKPVVKPRVKMRPLFWNRIVLEEKEIGGRRGSQRPEDTVWKRLSEPNLNVEEFERLFGKGPDCNGNDSSALGLANTEWKRASVALQSKTAKVLDDQRSRTVAIRIKSLHCQISDIERAVYSLDFSRISLDSLVSLSHILASKEELDKIEKHLKEKPEEPLDEPEQCLMQLSRIDHFTERVQCLSFSRTFTETLHTIDQQLQAVQAACSMLRTSHALVKVLEIILALGNYMNGGTQRGQADGFDIAILPKLKDVKSMDNRLNLLQYVVQVHIRDHEENAGTSEASFPLPDPAQLHQATAVSFTDLEKQLTDLTQELQAHKHKAAVVVQQSEQSVLYPFKDAIDNFFSCSDCDLSKQKDNLDVTKKVFTSLAHYMSVGGQTPSTSQTKKASPKDSVSTQVSVEQATSPEALFGVCSVFLRDYFHCWKEEQRRIAKAMFSKVEMKRKERHSNLKRRNSFVGSEVTSNASTVLKQKFSQMRRPRSETSSGINLRLLRTQSVNSLSSSPETVSMEDSQSPRSTTSSEVGRLDEGHYKPEVQCPEVFERHDNKEESTSQSCVADIKDVVTLSQMSDSVSSEDSQTMCTDNRTSANVVHKPVIGGGLHRTVSLLGTSNAIDRFRMRNFFSRRLGKNENTENKNEMGDDVHGHRFCQSDVSVNGDINHNMTSDVKVSSSQPRQEKLYRKRLIRNHSVCESGQKPIKSRIEDRFIQPQENGPNGNVPDTLRIYVRKATSYHNAACMSTSNLVNSHGNVLHNGSVHPDLPSDPTLGHVSSVKDTPV